MSASVTLRTRRRRRRTALAHDVRSSAASRHVLVVLACLLLLRTPDYGYALLERLSAAGIDTDGNTLYPLLRRLEKQQLVTSEWNTDEPRPRKFYRTSAAGQALACPEIAIEIAPDDSSDECGEVGHELLRGALESLGHLALERHHPGWELNDGAAGELVIDVAAASFTLGCSLRYTATEDHSTEL